MYNVLIYICYITNVFLIHSHVSRQFNISKENKKELELIHDETFTLGIIPNLVT